MKKINILILCSILCFFYSCNGMLDGIQPYLDEGEKIYVGTVSYTHLTLPTILRV